MLFGLLTFFVPGITLVTLVLLFGAYAFVDGIFNVIAFFRVFSHHWALLIEGLIGIIAGIVTFAWPAITAIALLYIIAFWAIFTGIFEIIAGIRLRKAITNEWLLLLIGVLSLVFGMLILFAPSVGALAIVYLDRRICVCIRGLSAGSCIPTPRAPAADPANNLAAHLQGQTLRYRLPAHSYEMLAHLLA